MATDFMPFALHDIGEEEIAEVVDTLRSNWITTGPKVAAFEKDFREKVGCRYALSVNSGTAGLHLALEAVGVQPGDLVITSPYTFTATAEVIRYLGADPVFIDIQPETRLIDAQKIEDFCSQKCDLLEGKLVCRADGRRVSAIIPVHIAGLACDMDAICHTADQYALKVVEDAAHAFPAFYKDQCVGSIGDATVFSFYATKTITTGEGGMVTTGCERIANRIKKMRMHGINRDVWTRYQSKDAGWYYEVVEPGFKYNMTDIQAAIGIHQLRKANAFLAKRLLIAKRYNRAFVGLPGIKCPEETEQDGHAVHLYILQIEAELIDRDDFIRRMSEKGIGTSVHFIPLHIHPYYRDRYGFQPEDFNIAHRAYLQAVSLPIYTRMTDRDIDRVILAVQGVLSEVQED